MLSFNQMQINISLPSMISEFRWPAIYTAFLQRVDIVNIDLPSLVGITCLVEFDYRYTVLTSLAIPIVLVGGSLLAYCIGYSKLRGGVAKKSFAERRKTANKLFDVVDYNENSSINMDEFKYMVNAVARRPIDSKIAVRVMKKCGATREAGVVVLTKEAFCHAMAGYNDIGDDNEGSVGNASLHQLISTKQAYVYVQKQQLFTHYLSGVVQVNILLTILFFLTTFFLTTFFLTTFLFFRDT